MHLNGNPGATQIIAYVVSGVGFLGAGVVLKTRQQRLGPQCGGDAEGLAERG